MSALLHALLAAPFGQLSSLFGSASAPNPPPPSGLMDTFASLADDCHLSADGLIITLVLAGLFANHFWRIVCFVLALRLGFPAIAAYTDDSCPITYPYTFWTIVYAACMYAPLLPFMNWRHVRQPVAGAVFVTGADSGMGQWTATRLASAGFRVYAGCFAPNSDKELKAKARSEGGEAAASNVIIVPLDVTKDESVAAAAARVAKDEAKAPNGGLVGVINCAGMGFNGPAEYFPLAMLKQQMEVNFIGYVRVVQAFLPQIKAAAAKPGARRGRVVFIGTGGGVMSPSPPLLCAYMASKWSVEAYCQTLRMEMQMRELPIDVCMLNPGFIKPTALISGGLPLTERMWAASPPAAKEEYGQMLEDFIQYSLNEPGTHVSNVAKTMLEIMTVGRPWSSYKVGFDSKAAPFCGMLPTGVRETVVKFSMYKRIGGNM